MYENIYIIGVSNVERCKKNVPYAMVPAWKSHSMPPVKN